MSVGPISGLAGLQVAKAAPTLQAKSASTLPKIDSDGDTDNGANDNTIAPDPTGPSSSPNPNRGQNIDKRV
jgi:hypothetical protein